MSTYSRHISHFQGEIVLDPSTRSTAHLLWIRKYFSSVRFLGNILKFWNDHSSVVRALSIVLGFLPLSAKMGKPRVNYSGQARRPWRYLNCRPCRSYRTKGWLEQGASNVPEYNFKMCWIDEHRHEISKPWSRRYELYINRLKSGEYAYVSSTYPDRWGRCVVQLLNGICSEVWVDQSRVKHITPSSMCNI